MSESITTAAEQTESADVKYRVGTLEYTKRGLVVLFFWLLWGDFCFSLMEGVFPAVTPLALRNLHAPNFVIGLIMTTIPGILNFVVCPWVSFKSDRHRGKLGRRIPFLLIPTPWLALFLALIGFSPEIGLFLKKTILAHSGVQASAIVLVLMGTFVVGFQYFNMFVGSVYYYLFNDVVPERFLGTFMGLFRAVGVASGALFQFFIFKYAETHMKEIFVGAAILYCLAFGLMCLRVKEGQYPPPPENADGKVGLLSSMKSYFVECFTHRFYWLLFLSISAWSVYGLMGPWVLFMQTKSLGLTLAQVGKMGGSSMLIAACLSMLAGMVVDLKHPIRTMLVAMGCTALVTPIRCIYLFHQFPPAVAYKIEFVLTMTFMPLSALLVASWMPLYMRIFPSDRFGQYCGAAAMVQSLVGIFAGMLAGGYMDLMERLCRTHGAAGGYYYRFAPVWNWAWQITAFLFMFGVYRHWKSYGGDKGYRPPAVSSEPKS